MEMLSPITSSRGLLLLAGPGLPPSGPHELLLSAAHWQPFSPGAHGPAFLFRPSFPVQYVHVPRASGHCTSDWHGRPHTEGWASTTLGGGASRASHAQQRRSRSDGVTRMLQAPVGPAAPGCRRRVAVGQQPSCRRRLAR